MLLSPVYKEKLAALVIDEAHCVKFWGDQFRQTFVLIGDLRSLIPSNVKLLALTATATIETRNVSVCCKEVVHGQSSACVNFSRKE